MKSITYKRLRVLATKAVTPCAPTPWQIHEGAASIILKDAMGRTVAYVKSQDSDLANARLMKGASMMLPIVARLAKLDHGGNIREAPRHLYEDARKALKAIYGEDYDPV